MVRYNEEILKMSRSFKKHFGHYQTVNVDPKSGKKFTSKRLRQVIREKLFNFFKFEDDEQIFGNLMDRNRGHKGSKNFNDAWNYFGDGWVNIRKIYEWMEERGIWKWKGK